VVDIKAVFGWRENGFPEKLFSMENVFLRKIDFHIIFSIVWYKINNFSSKKKKKYELSYFRY